MACGLKFASASGFAPRINPLIARNNLSEMSPMVVSLCTVGDYFFEPRRKIRWLFREMGSFRG